MSSLDTIISRLEAVDVQEIAELAVLHNKKEYLDLNRDQLWFGITKTGDFIAAPPPYPYPYSKRTVREKELKGQPTDRVTLRDTQSMWDYMTLRIVGNSIMINSDVPYMQEIYDQYTEDIFGLFWESREIFITKYYQTTFVNLLKHSLNL